MKNKTILVFILLITSFNRSYSQSNYDWNDNKLTLDNNAIKRIITYDVEPNTYGEGFTGVNY